MRSRSRTPAPRTRRDGIFWCDLPEVEPSCETVFENELDDYAVGSSLSFSRGDSGFCLDDSNVGCFEWMRSRQLSAEPSEDPSDLQAFVATEEVIEIVMSVAPRDVHCKQRNGVSEWVLNQKPKKGAEVSFKKLSEVDQVEMKQAMRTEVNSFLEKEAIDIASRHGVDPQKLLSMRWVLTYKPVVDSQDCQTGVKPKARLIIRGFEDPNLLHQRRDSPTLSIQNRNTLLSLAALYHWPVMAGDIKTAFLNGDVLPEHEHLFGDPPMEAREILGMKQHEILRIKKVIYGLLHAPRAWMDKLAKELDSQGWQRSRLEPCVWRLFDSSGVLVGLLGCHVDDLLVSGSGDYFQERIKVLRQSFPFGSWQHAQSEAISFCGCEVKQDEHFNVFVTQERYALGLNEINVAYGRRQSPEASATAEETRHLRAALGALSWRATQTSPWLAASVSVLQGCQKAPRVEHLLQTNKLIRTQRQLCEMPIKFSSQIEKPVLVTYTDASWACRIDGSSQGGQITMIADAKVIEGKRSEYSLLSWQSRKLSRIARSSTSAEVQMASNATDHHEFTKQILLEWFNSNESFGKHVEERMRLFPSILILDSKNLYDAMARIETSGLQLEEKRTALEVLSIRERTKLTGIMVKWVDSDQQLADGLSKPFHYDQLVDLLHLGVTSVVFDPLFTSAKRKKQKARQERHKELGSLVCLPDSKNQLAKEKEESVKIQT